MITPIVVIVHELGDRDFQIPWSIVWDLIDVKFNGPVIPLQFAVELRMEGRSQDGPPGPEGDELMGKSDTNTTTALAQVFGVIGNGSAEIAWVEHYTQGSVR